MLELSNAILNDTSTVRAPGSLAYNIDSCRAISAKRDCKLNITLSISFWCVRVCVCACVCV